VPRGESFDSILVGYYEGGDLKYAARIRAGFTSACAGSGLPKEA
jgi:hypothetical protein